MATSAALVEPFLEEGQRPAPGKKQQHLTVAQRKLLVGTFLCFLFMLFEIAGGIIAHSLAIVTDAAHMLSDVAGFLVGVMSIFLANQVANDQYSFGYHRAEVLGALVSIMIVWLMTGILAYEAVWRLIEPEVVDGCIMFWISVVGILMNAVLMLVLGHGSEDGHGHGHGHSHGHGHGHGHGAPRPPKLQSSHGHAEHDHAEDGHAEHGHGGHGDGDGCSGEHGHGGEHTDGEHEHGHAHVNHEHQHANHEHGHSNREHGSSSPSRVKREASKSAHGIAVRAAIIHVIGDILQSVGVCIAAALIWAFSDRWPDANGLSYWYRVDPVCTLFFSVLVMWTSIGTVQEAMHVLMAGVPDGIDLSLITEELLRIPDVVEVHDLHVWALSGDKLNMWAHLTVAPGAKATPILYAAQKVATSVECHHSCFQIEDTSTYDKEACGEVCYGPRPVSPHT